MLSNKSILIFACLITFRTTISAQSEFNNTDEWRVEFNTYPYINKYLGLNLNIQQRLRRSMLTVGYDLHYFKGELEELGLKLGYRYYPFKNEKKLINYFQAQYYYTYRFIQNPSNGNFILIGYGLEYKLFDRFKVGVQGNLGIGYVKLAYYPQSGWYTIFRGGISLIYIIKQINKIE